MPDPWENMIWIILISSNFGLWRKSFSAGIFMALLLGFFCQLIRINP